MLNKWRPVSRWLGGSVAPEFLFSERRQVGGSREPSVGKEPVGGSRQPSVRLGQEGGSREPSVGLEPKGGSGEPPAHL